MWQIQLFVKYFFCLCFSYIVCSVFSCGKMGSQGATELGLFTFPPNSVGIPFKCHNPIIPLHLLSNFYLTEEYEQVVLVKADSWKGLRF